MMLQSFAEQFFYILATNALKIGQRGNYHIGRSLFLLTPIRKIEALESRSLVQHSPFSGDVMQGY